VEAIGIFSGWMRDGYYQDLDVLNMFSYFLKVMLNKNTVYHQTIDP